MSQKTVAAEVEAPAVQQQQSVVPKMSELDKLLQEIRHPDEKVFGGHYLDHIIDEIALEGLDGITLQALGVRLEQRPNFEMEGFEDVAATTWKQLKMSKSLEFYVLPSDRTDLVKYAWDDYRDDRGNAYEPLHAPDDIYPYFPVEDKTSGIRGSCEHYKTRKNVSSVVRRVPYAQVIRLLGSRLIIVAVQSAREKALFGSNFKKHHDLTVVQYCMLERIGRARHKGEITRGKISLQIMKVPPKILFYNRKTLLATKLVIKQNASVKFENCRCPALITVFHLPRFYKRIESVASLNTRVIFTQLNQSETKSIPTEPLLSKYGKHTLRNLLQQFPELLETGWETASPPPQVEEELQESQTKAKKTKPKVSKVLRLKVNDIELQRSIIQKVLEGQNPEDAEPPDGGEQEEEKVSCKTSDSFSSIQVLRPYHEFTSVTQSLQLFRALVRSGVKGLTAKDMIFLGTTRLEARSATRYLTRYHIAREGVVKHFKQKSFTYTFNAFVADETEITSSLEQPYQAVMAELTEMRKMLAEEKLKQDEEINDSSVSSSSQTEDPDTLESPPATRVVTKIEIDPSPRPSLIDDADIIRSVPTSPISITNEVSESHTEIIDPIVPAVEESNPEIILAVPDSIESRTMPEKSPAVERNIDHQLTSIPQPTLTLVSADLKTSPARKTKTKDAGRTSKSPKASPQKTTEPATPTHSQGGSELSEETNTEYSAEQDDTSSLDALETEEAQVEAMAKGVDRSHKGDEVDEEIRRNMVRQRVDWNPTEDRLILLAFIGSALFIPKYNYLKVFIYNATQIRDLLLQRNKDSRSAKTSLAIRRRLHFLMNQKSYYDAYIGMMGAALRDEMLYNNYLKNFLHPPQARIYHLPLMPALDQVIEYLYRKFDSEEYVVTDTRGSLNGIETLLFMRQLGRMEHYWKAMMFLLFCPLGRNSKDRHNFRRFWRKIIKEKRSVSPVKDECSPDSDTDDRKGNYSAKYTNLDSKGPLEKAVLTSSSEDEMSSSDEEGSLLQDIIIADYAKVHPEYPEYSTDEEDSEDGEKNSPDHLELEYCFKFMRFFMKHCELLFREMARLNASDGKTFCLVAFDMNATSSNICHTARECTTDSDIRLWTARSVILDHIMTGDASRKAEKSMLHYTKSLPMEQAGKGLQRARILVFNKATRLLGISKLMLRQLANGLSTGSYDDALDFVKYLEEAPSIDSSACINAGILSCLVELTDHFRSTIRITESIFTLNDEWVPVYDDMMEDADIATSNTKKGKKSAEEDLDDESPRPLKRRKFSADEREEIEGIMECFEEMERELLIPKPRNVDETGERGNYTSSSTNALRLLRIRLNEAGLHMPGKQFTGFVERDFFSINLPNLEFTLRETRGLNHRVAGRSHPFAKSFMNELRNNLIELAYHYIDANLDKTVDRVLGSIGKFRILFELIDIAGSQGLSANFLLTKFTKDSLAKGLHYLASAKLIFSVGVKNRKFVTFNNSKDWLIAIRNQNNKEILGYAVMRPWLTAHGAISWVTVNRLIIAILGQLQKPSTELDEVCQLLQPILSPVETLIIIEVLVKIKLLMVYKLNEPDPELFCNHPLGSSEIEYHVDTLVDTDNVFVAVSPYTTFLHAQLQEAILNESTTKPVRKCTSDD